MTTEDKIERMPSWKCICGQEIKSKDIGKATRIVCQCGRTYRLCRNNKPVWLVGD